MQLFATEISVLACFDPNFIVGITPLNYCFSDVFCLSLLASLPDFGVFKKRKRFILPSFKIFTFIHEKKPSVHELSGKFKNDLKLDL